MLRTYPATSLHHVRPVTCGARICPFFWIQRMIRDDGHRPLLFGILGQTVAALAAFGAVVLVLTGFALTWRRYSWKSALCFDRE